MKRYEKLRIIIFVLVAMVLFYEINILMQPVWLEWNNYDRTQDFYEQPGNTIETIFLGASVTVNGIAPTELYEDYGICSYNLGTEKQPMLASYYWMEEAYRLHPETLKTFVLDVSMLRQDTDESFLHKALDAMQFSRVKLNAVKDYAKDFSEVFSWFIPVFTYHDRWSSLTKEDFEKYGYNTSSGTRGYHFALGKLLDSNSASEITVPTYLVDEEAEPAEFNEEALVYFKKMVEFCNWKGIKLVLIKTPVLNDWDSSEHNAAMKVAEKYQLDFFDFNFYPYIDEIHYNNATDSVEGKHMNYYGAKKLTAWLGNYLTQYCGNTDVRGNETYAFMETEVEEYNRHILRAELGDIEDVSEYLQVLYDKRDVTILITVKDDAAKSLSQEQRDRFALMGLEKLSALAYRDSYLGVIVNGEVIYEESKHLDKEAEDAEKSELISSYEGTLADGSSYAIISGGHYLGNISSCIIDGKDYSVNTRGLNIIVYDNKRQKVMDTTVFNTGESATRIPENAEKALVMAEGTDFARLSDTLQQLALYNRSCANVKKAIALKEDIGEDGFLQYLKEFWGDENYMIFLSVKDDAARSLDKDARSIFRKMGLEELAELERRDSYLAVVKGGDVLTEVRDHGETPITLGGNGYTLVSGGMDSGNKSSIEINGEEYSAGGRGINVVIYDTALHIVVDTVSFDTYAIPVDTSEIIEDKEKND